MSGIRHDQGIKEKAFVLKNKGYSYSEIGKRLNLAKSTLSVWFNKEFGKTFDKNAQLKHLSRARILATKSIKEKSRKADDERADRTISEIKHLPFDDKALCKALIAMLYWAEGSKHEGAAGLKIVNTDPKLLHYFLINLRKSFDIDEEKFRVGLQIHYYHKSKEVKKFWSKLLCIPEEKFWKIIVKKRSVTKKFRKNFMGICSLYYGDGKIRKEILSLVDAIIDKK